MADVELLPLPEIERYFIRGGDHCRVVSNPNGDCVTYEAYEAAMHAYARANVAHAIAPLQAEIEALRAEVEDYRTNGAAAVRFAPNSAHWSKELRRLFGDDARAGIEVLENWHLQELARAERLAEALREATDMLLADYPETAKMLRAALAQEDRND